MNKMKLTEEQFNIIENDGNIVVIAVPGSGKTTTITYKIQKILLDILDYQGVIAISYTNKASDELKERVSKIVPDIFNSFFGTIYSFYISEIIIPFSKYLFNIKDDLNVVSVDDIEETINLNNFSDNKEKIKFLVNKLKIGIVILECIPELANYIFDVSDDCKKYLKSRYTHIFIDEYQDCSSYQHEMFKKIVNLGIIGIAVGDPEQSIFKYSGSSPSFLIELSELASFQLFNLSINHRSHQSIISYAYKFLSPSKTIEIPNEKRVYKCIINGDENYLSAYIDKLIPKIITKFDVKENKDIAILTRNNSTAKLVFSKIATNSVYFSDTPIDKSNQKHEVFTRLLLTYIFGNKDIYPENVIESSYLEMKVRKKNKVIEEMINLRKDYIDSNSIDENKIYLLLKYIFNNNVNLSNIEATIKNDNFLKSYKPLDKNKIHIMTIHKSKGLEFDVVLILDLHKYIIPKLDFDNNRYVDLYEDKCIHYVSITRAKKAVLMLVNSQRHNSLGILKNGMESEFISDNERPDLIAYRNQ